KKEGEKLSFPQTAPLILPVDQSRLMARTVFKQAIDPPEGGFVPAGAPMLKSVRA
ncbi:hypothetical protein A2U01_0113241, partial [Trifolium medium]|nr:hypothetical protein [Trifolium medium]